MSKITKSNTPLPKEQYQTELRALVEDIKALHREAGTIDQMEKVWNHLESPSYDELHGQDVDTRWGSSHALEAERQEQEWRRRRNHRRTREIVFSISDVTLRKRIIALDRQIGTANLKYWRADNREEHEKYRNQERRQEPWLVQSVIYGLLATFFGYALGSGGWWAHPGPLPWAVPGSVGGGVVGVIVALYLHDDAQVLRGRRLTEARTMLDEDDRTLERILDGPPTFSLWEESSGEPADSETI